MKSYATLLTAILMTSAFVPACSSDPVVDSKQNKVLEEVDIDVPGSDVFMKKGNTRKLNAIAKYADDSTLDVSSDTGTVWSTSNAAEATVDKNGLVTALTAGTVSIKVTYNGKSADESLTITP